MDLDSLALMAELIIESKSNTTPKFSFKMKDYNCVILKHALGYLSCYIGLTDKHKHYNNKYFNIDSELGLTFSDFGDDMFLPKHDKNKNKLFWIGFDMSWWDLAEYNDIGYTTGYRRNFRLALEQLEYIIKKIQ